jgi:hypothetical protein
VFVYGTVADTGKEIYKGIDRNMQPELGNVMADKSGTIEESGTIAESDVVMETGTLMCIYENESNNLIVKDKVSGYNWFSAVQDTMYDMESANKIWQANMKSLFILAYTDLKEDKGDILKIQSGTARMEVTLSCGHNVITVEYIFSDLEITVAFEFTLDDDTLIVRIPENGIKEKGNYGVVSIEVMPFFGAVKNQTEGYILIPDGSGALIKFEEKAGQAVSGVQRHYIYGPETVEVKNQDYYTEAEGIKTVSLPVYGMKTGDSAFIAYITEGDTDASINLALSGYGVALNRVYAEFTYRRTYNASRAQIDLKGTSINLIDYRITKEMIPGDREIRFTFLRGDNADYSGMACTYRNYLLSNGKMVRRNCEMFLALDLFMGIKEKRIVFDYFVKMTDFQQAKEIVEELRNLGVNKMKVNLIGWTSGGYESWPVHFPVEWKLGGVSGLQELTQYIKEIGSRLYLQSNFVDAYMENGRFSKRNDTVKYGNGQTVTNDQKDRYLISPVQAYTNIQSKLNNFTRTGADGISFERIGSYIYYDYNKKRPVTREETSDYWAKILSMTRDRLDSVAVYGGNTYVLAYADRLFDIPVDCSGYIASDRSVPFYQMVVHGSIPYTSQPGNLFYDFDRQKLQWIEYGCMPYFELTYERSFNLKNTRYNHLFTSYYSEWIETASKVYHEFKNRLDGVWGQPIMEHIQLENDIFRLTYEDGSRIYINYRYDPVIIEGFEIKAMDYIAVLKGGVIK